MQIDPFSLEFRRNPYDAYKQLRETDRVHWSAAGAWLVTRYDDARSALCDDRLAHWTGNADGSSGFNSIMGRWVRLMDPRNSTHLRKLVVGALSPEVLDATRRKIRRLVRERLLVASHTGFVDIVDEIARPVTLAAFAGLLGVPAEEEALFEENVSRFSLGVFDFLGSAKTEARQSDALSSFATYVVELAKTKQKAPGDDVISALVRASAAGDDITEADYVAFAAIFLFAGQENIANFIGNAMLALITHPSQWELLRRRTSLFPNAVEELLRFDSSVQFVNLVALRDLELGGRAIREEEAVLVCVGSANRDPEQFPDPDRLDVTRNAAPHLTFGAGALYCIGAALARLEARVVLEEFVRPFAPPVITAAELEWRSSPAVLRGLVSLPVRFEPAGRAGHVQIGVEARG